MGDGSKKMTDDHNMDMTSKLPEHLLQHILSFLPFKDAVRTCILSKTWERASLTFPVLEFDENLFESDLQEMRLCRRVDVRKRNQIRQRLLNYWEQTLQARSRRKLSVDKLMLKVKLLSDAGFLDRCVCYAIESNVNELKLQIDLGGSRLYNLPQMVLCSESLNVLELRGCKLGLPKSNVKLSSLRRLFLSGVLVEHQVLENLVSGCPLIEELNVECCGGFKSLKLSGQSQLSEIKLMGNRQLEAVNINALNARLISIIGLVVLSNINVVACKSLKSLHLCSTSVVDEYLSYQISGLPVLENLEIICCCKLKKIKISSPCLNTLEISNCSNLAAVKMDTPNLSKFSYTGKVMPISSSGLTLSEANLYFWAIHNDSQFYVKFIELIAEFCQSSKLLNLLSGSGESVIVPRELRQILLPRLSGVKHMDFLISFPYKSSANIAQVVDGLLWMSPHVVTVSINYVYHFKKFFFKIIYKDEVVAGGGQCCCKSSPVLCWGQCIKKVEIEVNTTCTGCPVPNETKRFVFEDEDLLKEINDLGDLTLNNKNC